MYIGSLREREREKGPSDGGGCEAQGGFCVWS